MKRFRMSGEDEPARPRVIVVPRQLEDHFYEKLSSRFAGRSDVRVVVDRRTAERRHEQPACECAPVSERRRCERRETGPAWSLPELPFEGA